MQILIQYQDKYLQLTMPNFWRTLSKPIFTLAPMEDVTDTSFREIVARLSDPRILRILFTEFTSVDGMNHPKGKIRVSERLVVSETEKIVLKQKNIKLVAQIWGNKPELFHKIAREITDEYDFDGLDINMGCPVKNVVKNGCCSALISQPELAKEIILATKEATHLPVSVKTRTGIKSHDTEVWISSLLETKPAAIILHGRTQKMQSDGLADWEEIGKGARMRDQLNPETLFLGNGDVVSVAHGEALCTQYGLDGVMVGRGIFHNPWFFDPQVQSPVKSEKLAQLLIHTRLFEKSWEGKKNFNILKRFYKIYTSGFPEAAKLRAELMEARSFEEVYFIVDRNQKEKELIIE
ncbi:MAG: tRNA-dihydrouridine synthase [Mariniphaga sp.]